MKILKILRKNWKIWEKLKIFEKNENFEKKWKFKKNIEILMYKFFKKMKIWLFEKISQKNSKFHNNLLRSINTAKDLKNTFLAHFINI